MILDAIKKYVKNQKGASAVEYAVILALVVLLSIAILLVLEGQGKVAFNVVGNTVKDFGKIQ